MKKLQRIIHGQTIRIDNHLLGCGIPQNFNDQKQDVHIHKEYTDKDKKKMDAVIRIPLNSKKKVSFSEKVSNQIISEIRDVLDNPINREKFLNEVYDELSKNWQWESTDEAKDAIAGKIANAFSLRLSTTKNICYKDNKIHQITYFLKDQDNIDKKLYKMLFNYNKGFSIGEVNVKYGRYIYTPSVKFEKDN